MANQNHVTYQNPVQRDWSSEITPLPGQTMRENGRTRSGGMSNSMESGGTRSGGMSNSMESGGTRSTTGGGMGNGTRSMTGNGMGENRTAEQTAADWMRTLPAMPETPSNNTLSNKTPDSWADKIGAEIENNLPNDMIEAPTTLEEVYRGSIKSLLLRNLGNYVVATFLIGTQGTVSWEGILYDVGNDYVAIYQSGRDQYIVCDLYSLKYVEFYDTQRRALCDAILTEREESELRA